MLGRMDPLGKPLGPWGDPSRVLGLHSGDAMCFSKAACLVLFPQIFTGFKCTLIFPHPHLFALLQGAQIQRQDWCRALLPVKNNAGTLLYPSLPVWT